jgi:hypothetical protein
MALLLSLYENGVCYLQKETWRVMQLRKQLAKDFNDETGLSPDQRDEWEQWLKQNGHWPVIPNKKQKTAQPFCVQVNDKIFKAEYRGD